MTSARNGGLDLMRRLFVAERSLGSLEMISMCVCVCVCEEIFLFNVPSCFDVSATALKKKNS